MTSATIISAVRTPAGKLKGYTLFLDGKETYLGSSQIKSLMQKGELEISGMKINSAGALILVPASNHIGSPLQTQDSSSLSGTAAAASVPEADDAPARAVSSPASEAAVHATQVPAHSGSGKVHIYEAMDPFQKNYMAARHTHSVSDRAVAFVKRRIT